MIIFKNFRKEVKLKEESLKDDIKEKKEKKRRKKKKAKEEKKEGVSYK